jgi:hypothetical protein
MYAVTIERLQGIYFLTEPPGKGPWSVAEGVELDIPSNYDAWPEGAPSPEQVVCVSTSNPKTYKVFKYARDIDPKEFRNTGKVFGGLFSKRAWKAFRKSLAKHMAYLEIPDDDPPDSPENLRSGHVTPR